MHCYKDEELNTDENLIKDMKALLMGHRDHIDSLSHSEYQEYKERRNAKLIQN